MLRRGSIPIWVTAPGGPYCAVIRYQDAVTVPLNDAPVAKTTRAGKRRVGEGAVEEITQMGERRGTVSGSGVSAM